MDALALRDLADVDKKFDQKFWEKRDVMEKAKQDQTFVEMASHTVHDSREEYRRLITFFDEVEGTQNEVLG